MVSGLEHEGHRAHHTSSSQSHASTWRGLPPLLDWIALGFTLSTSGRLSFNKPSLFTVHHSWQRAHETCSLSIGPLPHPAQGTPALNRTAVRVTPGSHTVCHTTTFLTESGGYRCMACGWCGLPRNGSTQSRIEISWPQNVMKVDAPGTLPELCPRSGPFTTVQSQRTQVPEMLDVPNRVGESRAWPFTRRIGEHRDVQFLGPSQARCFMVFTARSGQLSLIRLAWLRYNIHPHGRWNSQSARSN